MKRKTVTFAFALVAVAFAAAACGAKEETPGEKVDKALEGGKDALDKAADDLKK